MILLDVQSQQLIMGLFKKRWPKYLLFMFFISRKIETNKNKQISLPMVGEEDCEVPPAKEDPDISFIEQSKVPNQYK
jgi:hypothetical protein